MWKLKQEEVPFGKKWIPKTFVQWGQSPEYIDREIQEGSYFRCFPGEIFSPSEFYVNLSENWFQLETFMAMIQATVAEWDMDYELHDSATPVLDLLAPGLFVLCKYFGPKDKRPEWHRAIVLQNPAFEDTPGPISKSIPMGQVDPTALETAQITVRLVDFGTIHKSVLSSIKYMPKQLLEFPIQAVQCQLLFSQPLTLRLERQGHKWPSIASETLFRLCEGRILGVTFFNMKHVESVPGVEEILNGKWAVSLDLIEGKKMTSTKIDVANQPFGLYDERIAKGLDSSLVRHPNGIFSNLIRTSNHNLNARFIQWIQDEDDA